MAPTSDKNAKLTFSTGQRPLNGHLSDITGNLVTYTPNPGFKGLDIFTYQARDSDANLLSNNGTVSINVSKPALITNANAPVPPIPTGFFVPLVSTVLIYAAIVASLCSSHYFMICSRHTARIANQ